MSRAAPQRFFLLELVSKIFKKFQSVFGNRALIAFAILLYGIYRFKTKKHDNIPSAPDYKPLIGHTLFARRHFFQKKDILDKEVEIFKQQGKNGGLFSVMLPTRTQIYFADPKIFDLIFREKFSDAIKHPRSYDVLDILLGDGIFSTNGSKWKKHRAVASHMFTVRALRDHMFDVFNTTANDLLQKFDEIKKSNDDKVNFYDMWNRLTFEAFTKIAFGVDVGVIKSAPAMAEFGFHFDQALILIPNRTYSAVSWQFKRKFRWIPGVANYENELDSHGEWLEAYVLDIISQRKQHYNSKLLTKTKSEKRSLKKTKQYDLLSMFIEDNKNITDKELRDITFNFIIAGKDTTSQTLSWMMYHIFDNNLVDIEQNIRKEIMRVFGEDAYNNDDIEIRYQDLIKCVYLEGCLKETLRLYPSVPHLVRTAVKDIKLPNGNILRKDDELFVCCYAMGRLPWIWDEPLKFKPERFMMDVKNQPDPSVYPAFNIAPRFCLGKHVAIMEAKIAIIKLFSKYKNIKTVPNQDIRWVPSPTNQMDPGFQAYLR